MPIITEVGCVYIHLCVKPFIKENPFISVQYMIHTTLFLGFIDPKI